MRSEFLLEVGRRLCLGFCFGGIVAPVQNAGGGGAFIFHPSSVRLYLGIGLATFIKSAGYLFCLAGTHVGVCNSVSRAFFGAKQLTGSEPPKGENVP